MSTLDLILIELEGWSRGVTASDLVFEQNYTRRNREDQLRDLGGSQRPQWGWLGGGGASKKSASTYSFFSDVKIN